MITVIISVIMISNIITKKTGPLVIIVGRGSFICFNMYLFRVFPHKACRGLRLINNRHVLTYADLEPNHLCKRGMLEMLDHIFDSSGAEFKSSFEGKWLIYDLNS